MAYTQADLDAVNKAILDLSTGNRVTSVTFSSGQSVEYAPAKLSELRALAASIATQLGTRRRFVVTSTGKGL